MARYDVTVTITVEAESQNDAWMAAHDALGAIPATMLAREILDISEPTLVEEEK